MWLGFWATCQIDLASSKIEPGHESKFKVCLAGLLSHIHKKTSETPQNLVVFCFLAVISGDPQPRPDTRAARCDSTATITRQIQ